MKIKNGNDNDKNNNNNNSNNVDNHDNNDDNENQNWQSYKNMKTLKQNEKCSSKSNSCLLKKRKRSRSHVLLVRKSKKL